MRNFADLTVTETQSASTTALATIAGSKGQSYRVTGFDGCSNDQSFKVELKFGSTVKLTMQGSADTTVGRDFNRGLIAAIGESVTVLTTPAAKGNFTANLIYEITLV